jgi:hypothetical protein
LIKRIACAILSLIIILSFASCGGTKYKYCELVLPLTEDFKKTENENFDASFTDGKIVVATVRISFVAAYNEGIPETLTPYEFGNFWVRKCGRDSEVVSEDGVSFCTYYEKEGESEYFYLESFLRSHSAYFVVLFVTAKSNEEAGRAEFLEYSKGIYFTK